MSFVYLAIKTHFPTAELGIIFKNESQTTNTRYQVTNIEKRITNSSKSDRLVIEYIRILDIWSFKGETNQMEFYSHRSMNFAILLEFECQWV